MDFWDYLLLAILFMGLFTCIMSVSTAEVESSWLLPALSFGIAVAAAAVLTLSGPWAKDNQNLATQKLISEAQLATPLGYGVADHSPQQWARAISQATPVSSKRFPSLSYSIPKLRVVAARVSNSSSVGTIYLWKPAPTILMLGAKSASGKLCFSTFNGSPTCAKSLWNSVYYYNVLQRAHHQLVLEELDRILKKHPHLEAPASASTVK